MPIYNNTDEILSINNIKAQLWKCINESPDLNKFPINIVSSDNRDVWSNVYERLKRNGISKVFFDIFF